MNDNIGSWYKQSFVFSNAFNPLSLSPIAWYDSTDLATITKDVDNKVSYWNDKSGNGYNLTAPGANQPTYSGTSGIYFNGTNWIKTSFTLLTQPFTIICVFKHTIKDGSVVYGGINQTNRMVIYNSSNNLVYFLGGSTISKIDNINTNIDILIANGTNSKIYDNNILKNSGNLGSGKIDGITLGWEYGNPYGATPMIGYIKEFLIYPTGLDSTQTANISSYLNSKYNVY